MYSAERTFFCSLTAIIEQIVAHTSRLRLSTAKIRFQRTPVPHIILPAKSANARRKRMAARSGQRGCIVKNGKFWAVRFRIDLPGQFERKLRYVRICPIEGEGALPKVERHRKALDIIAQEGANSEEVFNQTESSTVTFREQSQIWLTTVSNRRRKPIKRTRWQIGGVILSGLTPKLETCLWRASTTVRYGILFQKCQRQGSNQKP